MYFQGNWCCILLIIIIKLYFYTIKFGMAVPFMAMYMRDNSKQINVVIIRLGTLIK